MKSAFTMIELIFIIVIISVLAAIAIPKMNATRDDAKARQMSLRIEAIVSEVASSVVGGRSDSNEGNLSKMSNILKDLESEGLATIDTNNKIAYLRVEDDPKCIFIKIIKGSRDTNVSAGSDMNSTDNVCRLVQKVIKKQNYILTLRGQTVAY